MESTAGSSFLRAHASRESGATMSGRSAARWAAAAFLLVVAAVAIVGSWQAIVTLASPSTHGNLGDRAVVGHPATTGFGLMTVDRVDVLDGLTAQDVGGMTHGISNLVPAEQAQVEVAIRIDNTSSGAVSIDPDQFALDVVGATASATQTGATVRPFSLTAAASVELTLIYVVPRGGAEMTLAYTDPVTTSRVSIPIGRVDQAPSGGSQTHEH